MNYYTERYQLGFGAKLTPGIKLLLILNGSVYLLQLVAWQFFIEWFALDSYSIIQRFTIWQFFTYMFLHGESFFHIFFNMFILWIFGCEIERAWGTKEFLKYYLKTCY